MDEIVLMNRALHDGPTSSFNRSLVITNINFTLSKLVSFHSDEENFLSLITLRPTTIPLFHAKERIVLNNSLQNWEHLCRFDNPSSGQDRRMRCSKFAEMVMHQCQRPDSNYL